MKVKLITSESFRKASRKERREVCNGCGPKGYGWLVMDNLLGLNITPA